MEQLTTEVPATVRSPDFVALVERAAAGEASTDELDVLEADRDSWRATLVDHLAATTASLQSVRSLTGPERDQVVADFEAEWARLDAAIDRLDGVVPLPEIDLFAPRPREIGVARLQVSWTPGRVVAWVGGPGAAPGDRVAVAALLEAAGAPGPDHWTGHAALALPDGLRAESLSIRVGEVLGWLVEIGSGQRDRDEILVGDSAIWLGQLAIWAVDMAARGSMAPTLSQRKRGHNRTNDTVGTFSVRWMPALADRERMDAFAAAMPGAMGAVGDAVNPPALTRSALTGMVDAICREAARLVDVAAPPPNPHSAAELAEAFLTRLDGGQFTAPAQLGGDLLGRIDRWAHQVTNPTAKRLVVQLDPPDSEGVWHLSVLAPSSDQRLIAIERAIVNSGSKARDLEEQLARLERLLPALRRPGGHRRGEVILSQDEAWQLMSETGNELTDAGFDVRVPALSRRRPTARLHLAGDSSTPSTGGAGQLTSVRWSVLFDDVELSPADITRLAKEARPLIRSGGKWVALDKADLVAAAAALDERSDVSALTGAEMLRYALGLEASPLAGGATVDGGGWAANLLEQASMVTARSVEAPDGFRGELRSYQRDALGWLGFLDSAGLGGCLALDMGLGKTPTMLAHVVSAPATGPTLVIAPPAVVGNWKAEASRFTPRLRVVVHHGAARSSEARLAAEFARADVVLTTYGTAVRDIEGLEAIQWDRVILDEAQAIKNPTSETARQLRRIPARTRLALTGTPIENGLGDLWAILDFTNPGLIGPRAAFITQLSADQHATRVEAEDAMRALNGILVFRRTKSEPAIAAELPDRIDELDHCSMTPEQIGLYQAVLDNLVASSDNGEARKGQVLAAITALKQICNHPAAYNDDDRPLENRSGKLARLDEIVDTVFASGERVLIFTHFAKWGQKLAEHLSARTGTTVECYHGGLTRTARDKIIADFQTGVGPAALVLSLKAGGTGLNLTAANHVILYDRWWNPAVEDQARDRAWRIGQTKTVIAHRLVCPGTIDERVEQVVDGKRRIADLVLPKSSTLADLDAGQLQVALGLRPDEVLTENPDDDVVDADPNLEVTA